MKVYFNLVAICTFHPILGTTAFLIHTPKTLSFTGNKTPDVVPLSPLFSYLTSLGASSNTNTAKEDKPKSLSPPPLVSTPIVSSTKVQDNTVGLFQASADPGPDQTKNIWDNATPILVQGGSLKTWSYESPSVERVQVILKTEGRPLDADIDLWQGPDNTPHKMRVYIEDGSTRPFSVVVETPRGQNTIAIRNIGRLEFPMAACVAAESSSIAAVVSAPSNLEKPSTIQGGALRTYPFDASVDSVQVLLTTDGRPLNSRIELLQGPNNNKQVIEVYTEDGMDRPFFVILATPGAGNVVRIVNTAPVEFPLSACVQAYEMGDAIAELEPVIGGDNGMYSSPKLDLQW